MLRGSRLTGLRDEVALSSLKEQSVKGRATMFDANFFRTALPERVRAACEADTSFMPIVHLHLMDGAVLDVCNIAYLAEKWFAVAYFRDASADERLDVAFLRYDLVSRVTLSLTTPGHEGPASNQP